MTKIIHCIRHGQSTFNAHWAETGLDPMQPDAPLTELGHRLGAERAPELRPYAYELVVTSPLTRAIQTTLGLFGDLPSAPTIRVECLHREHLGNSCDQGRPPALLRREFPHLSFDHLEEVWWHRDGEPDHRGLVVEPDLVAGFWRMGLLAAGHRLERRHQRRGDRNRPAVARGADQLAQHVARLEEHVDRRLVDGHPAGAERVQAGLEQVGEFDELRQREGASAALDRVDGAEGAVDVIGRRAPLADGGEMTFEQADELIALVEVDVPDLGKSVHGRATS